MARVVKAPEIPSELSLCGKYKIFLAGSIDNGSAEDWQEIVAKRFAHIDEVVLFNPRRDNWDASATSDEVMKQIAWEQKYLELADFRFFVFLPNSMSPITLLELGKHLYRPGVVYCPKEYWRYANVSCEVATSDYLTLVEDFDQMINHELSIFGE